jgi:hypothetical protein
MNIRDYFFRKAFREHLAWRHFCRDRRKCELIARCVICVDRDLFVSDYQNFSIVWMATKKYGYVRELSRWNDLYAATMSAQRLASRRMREQVQQGAR